MQRKPRTLSRASRLGILALQVSFGVMLLPAVAEARSLVCAPDNRGCYYTRAKCSDVDKPKTWSCASALAAQKEDFVTHEANGRGAAVVGGRKAYLLSDALEARLAKGKLGADEFARLVAADNGAVSADSLNAFGKELGVPVKNAAGAKR